MKCSFLTDFYDSSDKRKSCPSEAHKIKEGTTIIEDYCSHHYRVVKAMKSPKIIETKKEVKNEDHNSI